MTRTLKDTFLARIRALGGHGPHKAEEIGLKIAFAEILRIIRFGLHRSDRHRMAREISRIVLDPAFQNPLLFLTACGEVAQITAPDVAQMPERVHVYWLINQALDIVEPPADRINGHTVAL